MILTPFLDDGDITLYAGDCIEVMRQLPEASIDAIITDPPYGINFMGKAWDGKAIAEAAVTGVDHTKTRERSGSMVAGEYDLSSRGMSAFQHFSEEWAREAFRVLKPGAHLLAFGGTRTYHRLAAGIEDAGFEIRDCLAWLYGSGFPKSKNVALAIDKGEGHPNRGRAIPTASTYQATDTAKNHKLTSNPVDEYEAKSEAAKKWDGWGTALKPAFEPVVLARKPLTGTVAANVLAHGTGALNINATRISVTDTDYGNNFAGTRGHDQNRERASDYKLTAGTTPANGRWPANVALDNTAAELLDEQSGERPSGARREGEYGGIGTGDIYGDGGTTKLNAIQANTGGASRFFYTAKASRQDRNTSGANNTHPTVKPTSLMRWLIRLTTPPGGIILDPFGGSGTTGVAARAENTRCILIEREDEYLNIIRQRLAQLSLFSVPDEDAA